MFKYRRGYFWAVFLIAFFCVVFASNRYSGSDPQGTLLVSSAIIEKGTIKLDHYGAEILGGYGSKIRRKDNGHYYYYFPMGTSLVVLPFVAVAKGIGLDVVRFEGAVQTLIASFTSIVTLFLFFLQARFFLDEKNALIVSSVFWFGTALSSTSGTALWSHNFAVVFALLSIYFSIRAVKTGEGWRSYLIGGGAFLAYLCRPTMALFLPFILLFIFSYSKSVAVKIGLFFAFLFGLFVLFSWHEFGQMLPDYYLPKRLSGGDFWVAIYGNLLSPARGILVYSPFIVASWFCIKFSCENWGLKKSWMFVGVAWPVVHLIFVSRFPHWWAGWSYGARFMTDVLPGLFLLTLFVWPINFRSRAAQITSAGLLVFCIFSIVANTGQGLFNKWTAEWNAHPNIDRYPEYLFDWKYPQFFSNKHGHENRLIMHAAKHLQPISRGMLIDHKSDFVVWMGWSGSEPTHRWSEGHEVSILFNVKDPDVFKGVLELHLAPLGEQKIIVKLNDKDIYLGGISADEILNISLGDSMKGGINSLRFTLPDARKAGNGDPRILGVAIKSLRIY